MKLAQPDQPERKAIQVKQGLRGLPEKPDFGVIPELLGLLENRDLRGLPGSLEPLDFVAIQDQQVPWELRGKPARPEQHLLSPLGRLSHPSQVQMPM